MHSGKRFGNQMMMVMHNNNSNDNNDNNNKMMMMMMMHLLRFASLLKLLSPISCGHHSPPGQRLRIGLQQGAGGV